MEVLKISRVLIIRCIGSFFFFSQQESRVIAMWTKKISIFERSLFSLYSTSSIVNLLFSG